MKSAVSVNAPIGVFDSGIGGLTVAREIMSLMPAERIVYLGDTARVPYGVRSRETVRRYACEGTAFLAQHGIKLLVIACNTVSAICLDEIIAQSPVPVVGVIRPGARAAAAATLSGHIGVIGTEATVGSGAYERAIAETAPNLDVTQRACPLFVPLVEEGWHEGEVPELVAKQYLQPLIERGIDALVLGCTHYPLLKPMLSGVLGPQIRLIDSARETAREVQSILQAASALAPEGAEGTHEYYVTDDPEKFRLVGERFLGRAITAIHKIHLEVCS